MVGSGDNGKTARAVYICVGVRDGIGGGGKEKEKMEVDNGTIPVMKNGPTGTSRTFPNRTRPIRPTMRPHDD